MISPIFQATRREIDEYPEAGYVLGKWYFWDEIWVNTYGPFDNKEEATIELEKYCEANKL